MNIGTSPSGSPPYASLKFQGLLLGSSQVLSSDKLSVDIIGTPEKMGSKNLLQTDDEARQRLIRYLRKRMAEFGITLAALEEFIDKSRPVVQLPVRTAPGSYRDAAGNTWDGFGVYPDWMRRAMAAGQLPDHFRTR